MVATSDAEAYVARRFPHKNTKQVGNGLRAGSAPGFLRGLPLVFQRGRAKGLSATYHFTFTGEEKLRGTVVIRDQQLRVADGHTGRCDLHIIVDSRTWVRFLAKEANLLWAVLRGKIRVKGSARLMLTFQKCFPA